MGPTVAGPAPRKFNILVFCTEKKKENKYIYIQKKRNLIITYIKFAKMFDINFIKFGYQLRDIYPEYYSTYLRVHNLFIDCIVDKIPIQKNLHFASILFLTYEYMYKYEHKYF